MFYIFESVVFLRSMIGLLCSNDKYTNQIFWEMPEKFTSESYVSSSLESRRLLPLKLHFHPLSYKCSIRSSTRNHAPPCYPSDIHFLHFYSAQWLPQCHSSYPELQQNQGNSCNKGTLCNKQTQHRNATIITWQGIPKSQDVLFLVCFLY